MTDLDEALRHLAKCQPDDFPHDISLDKSVAGIFPDETTYIIRTEQEETERNKAIMGLWRKHVRLSVWDKMKKLLK